jgi:ABC-type uncharacterized transport system auxiliary subunit
VTSSKLVSKFIIGIFLLLTAGCLGVSQQAPEAEFYTLEYELPSIDGQKLPVVLKVDQFAVSPLYNTINIVYRDQEFQRKEYAYHKWRISPGSMIASLLSRDLSKSGLFKAITAPDSTLPCNYMLEGRVNKIFEKDLPDKWLAVLEIEVTLLRCGKDYSAGKIIYQRSYQREVKSPERNPVGVVQALSQGMREISLSIIKDLHEAIKD